MSSKHQIKIKLNNAALNVNIRDASYAINVTMVNAPFKLKIQDSRRIEEANKLGGVARSVAKKTDRNPKNLAWMRDKNSDSVRSSQNNNEK